MARRSVLALQEQIEKHAASNSSTNAFTWSVKCFSIVKFHVFSGYFDPINIFLNNKNT